MSMPRKPTPKPDDPDESKRFIDMAREIEADEDPKALDRAFDKVISPKRPNAAAKNARSK